MKSYVWGDDSDSWRFACLIDLLEGGDSSHGDLLFHRDQPHGLTLNAGAAVVEVSHDISGHRRNTRSLMDIAVQQTLSHELLDGGLSGRAGHFIVAGNV